MLLEDKFSFGDFRPIFRGYVCFRQGGTSKRKREEGRQGEGSHSGEGLMASNSAGIVRLTGDITRWRGALDPRRSGRDLLHFGDCGLHGHDVEEVSGASRDCISSRGQAVVGAGSGNWNAASMRTRVPSPRAERRIQNIPE